jgi:hypothetical protein
MRHVAAVLVALAGAAAVSADTELPDPPACRALRLGIEDAIHVDGRLDELAWAKAPIVSGFRQREPVEGAAATEDTVVRVLYDGDRLYVGILAQDREPERILARILRRDKVMELDLEGHHKMAGDDGVAVLLDPFHDRRNAFVFATNPNGATFDALVTDEGQTFNADWQGVWDVAAQRTAEGWSAEFAIPFRTLRYPSSPETRPWGFNVLRVIQRKNEETLLSGWSRDEGGFHRVSRAGLLEGLAELPRSGRNVELKPYGLTGRLQERQPDPLPDRTRWDVGLDTKWELRPGLVLDGTLHPDFAQVEADDQQINLTRFDLFYPEKRDFFLENAGIFEFGAPGYFETPPFLLFFSRRIGLDDAGDAIPVLGGLRLSGRVGRQTIGVLGAMTDASAGQPRNGFSLVRVKRDIGSAGYVGGMIADRRTGQRSNSGAGADWSFWPSGSVNVTGFVARTETSGPGGDGTAARLGLDYTGDRFGFSGQHILIGPETTADMGFITRTDIRRSDGLGRATVRPAVLGLRKIDLLLGANLITDLHGVKQDASLGPAVDLQWNSGERLRVFFNQGSTHLPQAFDLSGRVNVPAGTYDMRQLSFFSTTSPQRAAVLTASGDFFHIYDGRVSSATARASLATGPHVALSLGYTRDDVRLPAGSLGANLFSLRVDWALSTRLTAFALVQYNDLEHRFQGNLRLNFIHRPGSDLYVVFNEERGSELSAWRLARRGLVAKITYLLRL